MPGQTRHSQPDHGHTLRAALGPTNTGKTHLAVERMLGYRTGMIGLPLRLLAREIYDRIQARAGTAAVALVTGEERIVPDNPRYWVCTAEAMPLDREVDFLAVDEVQLCADHERGHVFTHRLLHARGTAETMLLGAETMRPMIARLASSAEVEHRERFSTLTYAGKQRLTALPRRSAIVAFSTEEVYAIAELIRRKRGGAAVVMGALSPRTRNAQVNMFQEGEVDYIVATDAIGMGLNLEIDHVAFASLSKFDGRKRRRLVPAEMGQIAGRAGRFRNPGTFGMTGDAPELESEDVRRIETHAFKPLDRIEWRNFDLDLSSLDALQASLAEPPPHPGLRRVRRALDEEALHRLSEHEDIAPALRGSEGVRRLWAVCQVPDFRKLGVDSHVRLLATIFTHLTDDGRLRPDWLGAQIARLERVDGDVDTLSARLAQVRTWAYLANRDDWLRDADHWRGRAREVEDRLSDALHERLTQRFVDRRTSVLLRGLREQGELLAGVSADGEVTVEGHHVGHIEGLTVVLDPDAAGLEAKALRGAAEKALRPEIDRRLGALARAGDGDLSLDAEGRVIWNDLPAARLDAGPDILRPSARLIGGELGAGPARARAERRIEAWLQSEIASTLAPLRALEQAVDSGAVTGLARGVAWRLREQLGSMDRRTIGKEIDALSAAERRPLRKLGVQIGRFSVFIPALLKPKPAALLARLRAVAGDDAEYFAPAPGLTSVPMRADLPDAAFAAAGFRPAGPRAVRLDTLEALGEEVEKARAETAGPTFPLTPSMTSRLGCSVDELRGVLRATGHTPAQRPGTGEDGAATPELWRRRGQKREREAPPSPRKADISTSPFAKLAELKPAAARKAPKPARKRPARKRRAKSARGDSKSNGA